MVLKLNFQFWKFLESTRVPTRVIPNLPLSGRRNSAPLLHAIPVTRHAAEPTIFGSKASPLPPLPFPACPFAFRRLWSSPHELEAAPVSVSG